MGMMERDLTWGGEHTIQYIGDILQNRTPHTYIILLTSVTFLCRVLQKQFAIK